MSQLLLARSQTASSPRRSRKSGLKPMSTTPALHDIDTADAANPLAVADYACDIYSYYRRVEPGFQVAADYMTRQVRQVGGGPLMPRPHRDVAGFVPASILFRPSPAMLRVVPHVVQSDVNERMRAILVDWLVDVHLKFKVCWFKGRWGFRMWGFRGWWRSVCERGTMKLRMTSASLVPKLSGLASDSPCGLHGTAAHQRRPAHVVVVRSSPHAPPLLRFSADAGDAVLDAEPD